MGGISQRPPPRPGAGAGERHAALHATGLLGAPAEERFDRLTRLTRRLLGTPVALVSVLDANRQFFLSAQGLPEPWATQRETPLSHSFCHWVVEANMPLLVTDAREDPRVSGNPAICDLGVVAYLAAPLALPDGCVVGALCAIDSKPRHWSRDDEQALVDLASVVTSEIAAGLRLREQQATTAALRDSEAYYRALFDVSPQIVWFAQPDGQTSYVNPYCADFVGLAPEQLCQDGWLVAVHSEDRERVLAVWAEAVTQTEKYEIDFRLRHGATGVYRWFLVRAAPLRGDDGRVERWIGVGLDIDDRRRAETALRELIEALGVAVYTTNAAGQLTFYNEAAVRLWGWRPPLGDDQWCGGWRLYRSDGTPMTHDECPMAQALRERRPVPGEAVAERPDGSRVPFAAFPTPLRDAAGTLTGGVNVLVDISDRKKAEVSLAESEARLRLALEAGRHAFWELDLATGAVVRAPFHDEIFGYKVPLEAWSYEAFLDHVLADDRELVERAYQAAVKEQIGACVECRIQRSDDSEVRWVEVHGRPHPGIGRQAVRLHGVLRDITERKRTETALRNSEARLRSILETVPDAMMVIDEHGIIESFSAAAQRLFDYAPDEIIGQNVTVLIPSADPERHDGGPIRHATMGEHRAINTRPATIARHKDGSTFPIEVAVGEVHLDGRRLFTGFVRDLTEWRATQTHLQELQAELLHISRVSAAGEMASALAHELNQPLTAATSAIRAAQRMLPLTFSATGLQRPADIHEAMDLATEQALRAGQIVRRLRDFVSWGDVDKRLEEPRKLVEEAGTLALVGATERGIQVEHRIESGLPSVIVDRIQIQQVLFNLIRNAVDAMATAADKGADVSARCKRLIVSVKSADAKTVEIAVADTGPGLAPGVANRLFDSFVSTKPGGMGMGLSICRSIVEAHGGRIWTEPNPGGGTLFRFTLPAAPLSDAESC